MKMFLIVGLVVAGLAGQVIAEEAYYTKEGQSLVSIKMITSHS
jgi:hypothetical protein